MLYYIIILFNMITSIINVGGGIFKLAFLLIIIIIIMMMMMMLMMLITIMFCNIIMILICLYNKLLNLCKIVIAQTIHFLNMTKSH